MVFKLIWSRLIEYACVAWLKTLQHITKEPSHTDRALKKFDADGGHLLFLCIQNGLIVSWDHYSPLTEIGQIAWFWGPFHLSRWCIFILFFNPFAMDCGPLVPKIKKIKYCNLCRHRV